MSKTKTNAPECRGEPANGVARHSTHGHGADGQLVGTSQFAFNDGRLMVGWTPVPGDGTNAFGQIPNLLALRFKLLLTMQASSAFD